MAEKMIPCPDCDETIIIASDIKSGNIVSCACCGGEYEVEILANGQTCLKSLDYITEDWGE